MTAYQNAQAAMIAAVYGTIKSEEGQALLADFAPVQACLTDLGGHVETLDQLVATQNERSGFAQEKEQKAAELAQLAAEVCGAAVSYSESSGNERLVSKLSIPFSELSAGKDSQIISHCRNIHKAASSVLESLGEFKVTAAKLKSLKQKTDDYKKLSTKPREAAATRKAATRRIPTVLRQASRLLRRRLDPLMTPFKASHPEFFAQYKAARRIVRPATVSSKVTALKPEAAQPAPVTKAG